MVLALMPALRGLVLSLSYWLCWIKYEFLLVFLDLLPNVPNCLLQGDDSAC